MVASLALALGYDRIVGVGIVQLGVCIGFTTGAFNIFTTGICQELAGISISPPGASGSSNSWCASWCSPSS